MRFQALTRWTINGSILLSLATCGQPTPLKEHDQPSRAANQAVRSKLAVIGASSQAQVQTLTATVSLVEDGVPVVGALVSLSRSVAGRASEYRWSGTTDADGRFTASRKPARGML